MVEAKPQPSVYKMSTCLTAAKV